MAYSAFTFALEEQIAYIKIEARLGKSRIKIQKALKQVGSESLFAYSSIRRWVREFNNYNTCPRISTSPFNYCFNVSKI